MSYTTHQPRVEASEIGAAVANVFEQKSNVHADPVLVQRPTNTNGGILNVLERSNTSETSEDKVAQLITMTTELMREVLSLKSALNTIYDTIMQLKTNTPENFNTLSGAIRQYITTTAQQSHQTMEGLKSDVRAVAVALSQQQPAAPKPRAKRAPQKADVDSYAMMQRQPHDEHIQNPALSGLFGIKPPDASNNQLPPAMYNNQMLSQPQSLFGGNPTQQSFQPQNMQYGAAPQQREIPTNNTQVLPTTSAVVSSLFASPAAPQTQPTHASLFH